MRSGARLYVMVWCFFFSVGVVYALFKSSRVFSKLASVFERCLTVLGIGEGIRRRICSRISVYIGMQSSEFVRVAGVTVRWCVVYFRCSHALLGCTVVNGGRCIQTLLC